MKKVLAKILIISMLIGQFGNIGVSAETTSNGSNGENQSREFEDAIYGTELEAFGFEIDKAPEGYDPYEIGNPMGKTIEIDDPIYELYLATSPVVGTEASAYVYGHNSKVRTESEMKLDNTEISTFSLNDSEIDAMGDALKNDIRRASPLEHEDLIGYDAFTTASGDFTGDGLRNQMVLLGSYASGYSIDMFIYDPLTGINDTTNRRTLISTFDADFSVKNTNIVDEKHIYRRYLEIATGDFTGNGIDEIAVYIPEGLRDGKLNSRIEVYALKTGEAWDEFSSWTCIQTKQLESYLYTSQDGENLDLDSDELPILDDQIKLIPNLVSLASGDLNGDKVDDLCIVWSAAYKKDLSHPNNSDKHFTYSPSQGTILFGNKASGNQYNFAYETKLDLENLGKFSTGILKAGVTIGDADGDGSQELYIGGYSVKQDTPTQVTTHKVLRQYNIAKGGTAATEIITSELENTHNSFTSDYAGMIAVADLEGDLNEAYIYFDGSIYKKDQLNFTIAYGEDSMTDSEMNNISKITMDVQVGDFYGTGRETIILKKTKRINYESKHSYELYEINLKNSESDRLDIEHLKVSEGYIFTSLLNTDNDSVKMEYTGEHYYEYKDPVILAVLLSPPYYGDLGHLEGGDSYISESGTSYTTSTSLGIGANQSMSLSLGGYVSVEAGVGILGNELKGTVEVDETMTVTAEFEQSLTITHSVEFGTAGGQDTVVLASVPMEVYVYECTQLDANGNEEKFKLSLHLPCPLSVKTYSIEEYDDIAAKSSKRLPIMKGEMFHHELGNPSTYPLYTPLFSTTPILGLINGVGHGPDGYISSSIATEFEMSAGFSYTKTIATRVGVKGKLSFLLAGEVEAGISGSREFSIGLSTTAGIENEITGTLAGMPLEASKYGYGYNWKVYSYQAFFPQSYLGTFPVVGFTTTSTKMPPKLPSDFHINPLKTTDKSICLEWSNNDASVVAYQLYRNVQFPGEIVQVPIGDIIYANDSKYWDQNLKNFLYSFNDEGLEENTSYTYSIQAIREKVPALSVISDTIRGVTKIADGYPLIDISDKEIIMLPDRSATVSVDVTNIGVTPSSTFYQWQKKTKESYEDIAGENHPSITWSLPSVDDIGDYRCKISQIIGDIGIIDYSDSVKVDLRKYKVGIDTSVTYDGTDPIVDINFENLDGTSGTLPAGTADVILDGSKTYYLNNLKITNASIRLNDLNILPDGAYDISVNYNGDKNCNPSESSLDSFIVGGEQGYAVELDNSIVYGEGIVPVIYKATLANDLYSKDLVTHGDNGISISQKLYYWTLVYSTSGIHLQDIIPHYPPPKTSNNGFHEVGANKYVIVIEIDDGGKIYKIERVVDVTKREVEISAFKKEVNNASEVEISGAYDISAGSFASNDSLASLGYRMLIDENYNNGYPGLYKLGIEELKPSSQDPHKYDSRANYNLKLIEGSIRILDKKYKVNIADQKYMNEKVGEVGLIRQDSESNEYFANENVMMVARPHPGYVVESWLVNGELIQGDQRIISMEMPTKDSDVLVNFTLSGDTVTFRGEHGQVNCIEPDIIASGNIVTNGVEMTFEAIPDEGYHFSEWRIIGENTQYPEGTVDELGIHHVTVEMGEGSLIVEAVFARNSYEVSLSDNLRGKYLYNDDFDASTPKVEKIFTGQEIIVGDTEISIEAKPGFKVIDSAIWYINDIATEYKGENMKFILLENSNIGVETENLLYNLSVEAVWDDMIEAPGQYGIEVSVDGQTLDSSQLANVKGGSKISFSAITDYGVVFDYFLVNGEKIDPSNLDAPDVLWLEGNKLWFVGLDRNLNVKGVFKEEESYSIKLRTNSHGALNYQVNNTEAETLAAEGVKTIKVYLGDDLELHAKPDKEFMVRLWVVDGVSYPTLKRYMIFQDIKEDKDIEVYFTPITYFSVNYSDRITEVIVDGKQAIASGAQVGGGQKVDFTAQVIADKMVEHWTINDQKVRDSDGALVLDEILVMDSLEDNVTLDVYHQDQAYHTVQIGQLRNGLIVGEYNVAMDPDTGTIRKGAKGVFRITPDKDHKLISVFFNDRDLIDDLTVMEDGSFVYMVKSIQEDLVIQGIFKKEHEIEVADHPAGTISVSVEKAIAGDLVSLSLTANDHYAFKEWQLKRADNSEEIQLLDKNLQSTEFTMPDCGVIVGAIFNKEHEIRVSNQSGGRIRASTDKAFLGDLVSLSTTTNPYYSFRAWKVIRTDTLEEIEGFNKNLQSTEFTMPDCGVTVSAFYSYWKPDPPIRPVSPIKKEELAEDKIEEMEDEGLSQAGLFDKDAVFKDLNSVEWAKKEIEALTKLGYIEGRKINRYEPNEYIRRDEFTAFAVNLLGLYDLEALESFEDVAEDDKYSKHIASGFSSNLIKGYSEDEFGLEDFITRQDAVVILVRALSQREGIVLGDYNALEFLDKAEISQYAQSSVATSVKYELIQGYDVKGGRNFGPKNNITRAEAAVVIFRYYEKYLK